MLRWCGRPRWCSTCRDFFDLRRHLLGPVGIERLRRRQHLAVEGAVALADDDGRPRSREGTQAADVIDVVMVEQQVFPWLARIFLLRETHHDLRLAVVARRLDCD